MAVGVAETHVVVLDPEQRSVASRARAALPGLGARSAKTRLSFSSPAQETPEVEKRAEQKRWSSALRARKEL